MQIRCMRKSDYAMCRALWDQMPGLRMTLPDDSEIGFENYLNRNPTTCFVAAEDTVVVGTVLCGHDGRRGYIYHMAVAAEYQGQGVGHRLLQHAMQALKAEGIHKTALVVLDSNAQGNTWWEKQGFAAREDLIYRDFLMED